MERKISRSIIVLAAGILQVSFLSAVFPKYEIPQIVLMLVISWTIIVGFKNALFWIITAGIILDLLAFKIIGTNVIVFVMVSYFVSFFSRRFLVENKGWGTLVMIFFVIISTLFYHLYNYLFSIQSIFNNPAFADIWENIIKFRQNVIIQTTLNIFLFILCYPILAKIESYLSFYEKKIEIK